MFCFCCKCPFEVLFWLPPQNSTSIQYQNNLATERALEYNTVVVLCQFLVLAGNSFLCYVSTQCMIQLCGCVSFSVMAGNSSQNENTFLQKNLIGLFFYDLLADVCFFIRPNTLLLCISLFCILLLYRTDPQVEVHIRILL